MRTRRWASSILCISSLIAICGSANAQAPAATDAAVLQSIQTGLDEYKKLFAAHDAAAIAQLWSPNGTLIDSLGNVCVGREQITQEFVRFFKSQPNTTIRVDIGSVKNEGNTAVEKGIGTLLDSSGNPISRGKYLAVHRLVDGKWLIDSLVEYPGQAAPQALSQLNWLKGTWQAGNGLRLNTNASSSGDYLISEFSNSGESGPDLMITSIDPTTHRLVSRIFDRNGGIGLGTWDYTNGEWNLASRRRGPSGTAIAVTHTIRPESGNTMKWKTVNRTVAGVRLPDTEVVVATKTSEGK